jgi:hypothetical protein
MGLVIFQRLLMSQVGQFGGTLISTLLAFVVPSVYLHYFVCSFNIIYYIIIFFLFLFPFSFFAGDFFFIYSNFPISFLPYSHLQNGQYYHIEYILFIGMFGADLLFALNAMLIPQEYYVVQEVAVTMLMLYAVSFIIFKLFLAIVAIFSSLFLHPFFSFVRFLRRLIPRASPTRPLARTGRPCRTPGARQTTPRK